MAEESKSIGETLKNNALNIILIALVGGGYGLEGFEQSSQSGIEVAQDAQISSLTEDLKKAEAKQERMDDADSTQNSQIQLIIYRLQQLEN